MIPDRAAWEILPIFVVFSHFLPDNSVFSTFQFLGDFLHSFLDEDGPPSPIRFANVFSRWAWSVQWISSKNLPLRFRVWSSGSSPARRLGFQAHPGATTFHPSSRLTEVSTLLTGPSASRRHLFSAHDHGQLRSNHQSLRWPDRALSRLRAEEHDQPVTQSTATPEPGCPDPHPRSSAGRLLEPWVCRHTREPTVLSRVSAAWILTVFTSLACYPGAPPYCHRNTAGFGRDRWGLSSPYHVATTYPCGQPSSSSLATKWRFLPRRLDGTTAGR